MTKTRGELKLEAKAALSGRRLGAVIFLVFCAAVIQAVNYIVSYFSLKAEAYDIVVTCVYVFLGYPFLAAILKYFLVVSRGEKKKLSDIFSSFDRSYMTVVYFAFVLYALMYAANFLLSIEFKDVAIVTMLSVLKWIVYIFVYVYAVFGAFVIADNTDLDFKSFILETNGYIKGNVIKLLVLTLSFIGWFLLGTVTVGIAFLWIVPYFLVTLAEFYESIRQGGDYAEEDIEEPEIVEEPKSEPEEETDGDSVTRDLSKPKEEKGPSPDETVVFTKEMLEKIKNSGKID